MTENSTSDSSVSLRYSLEQRKRLEDLAMDAGFISNTKSLAQISKWNPNQVRGGKHYKRYGDGIVEILVLNGTAKLYCFETRKIKEGIDLIAEEPKLTGEDAIALLNIYAHHPKINTSELSPVISEYLLSR